MPLRHLLLGLAVVVVWGTNFVVIRVALEQLPPRCRQVVILSRIEGLSRSEIAQRMGIAESTVSAHLTDGMYALADHLYGEPFKPGSDT